MYIYIELCIGILVALLLLIALAAYIPYRMAFYADQKKRDLTRVIPHEAQYQAQKDYMLTLIDALAAKPYEQVEIRSRDGKRLYGKYYHQADGAPLDIGCHGYKSDAVRDFCGGSRISFEMGHNLLLIDQRAHGKSDGRTISFGIRERCDVLDWIAYANRRFGDQIPIYLYGVSMGGATVLMASGLDLPENVKGIVADCPYSSPAAIIRKVCVDRGLPPRPLFPLLRLGALLYGRFRMTAEASAVEAVKRTTVPILIIHGEDDRFVPCSMSQEIQAANPAMVKLVLFPGAGHALSYIIDGEEYKRVVNEAMFRDETT